MEVRGDPAGPPASGRPRDRPRPGLGVSVVLTVAAGVLLASAWPALAGPGRAQRADLHVAAAIIVLPLLVVHAWGRRQRPTGTDLSRRSLLRDGGVGLGAAALWTVAEGSLRLTGSPARGGGPPARTSSAPATRPRCPSPSGSPTPCPRRRRRSIELVVGSRRRRIPVADLDRGDRVRAVLDCTGGWYAEQDWAGTRLDHLLAELAEDLPEDGSVDVVSQTGFRRRLPLRDAGSLLLATRAGEEPLSLGHGRRSGSWRPAGGASGGSSGCAASRSWTRPGGCSRRSRCSDPASPARWSRDDHQVGAVRAGGVDALGPRLEPGQPVEAVAAVDDPQATGPSPSTVNEACRPSAGGAWKVTHSRSSPAPPRRRPARDAARRPPCRPRRTARRPAAAPRSAAA